MEKESKVLFIGSLPERFTSRDLEMLLSGYAGVTKCFIVKGKFCGFAMFETDEQADEALNQLNSVEIEGKAIFANFANVKRE